MLAAPLAYPRGQLDGSLPVMLTVLSTLCLNCLYALGCRQCGQYGQYGQRTKNRCTTMTLQSSPLRIAGRVDKGPSPESRTDIFLALGRTKKSADIEVARINGLCFEHPGSKRRKNGRFSPSKNRQLFANFSLPVSGRKGQAWFRAERTGINRANATNESSGGPATNPAARRARLENSDECT